MDNNGILNVFYSIKRILIAGGNNELSNYPVVTGWTSALQ
jgi:hypothetical protein